MNYLENLQDSKKNSLKLTQRLIFEHLELINALNNINTQVADIEVAQTFNADTIHKIKLELEGIQELLQLKDNLPNNEKRDNYHTKWWECPNCKTKVDLEGEIRTLFDEDGEAWFDPEFGVPFYVVKCKGCPSAWNFGISSQYEY